MSRPALLPVLALIAASGTISAQQPRPVFRSGVELVRVEAYVVDRDGKPVPNLTINDFDVRIDGRKRTIVSADLVSYVAGATEKVPTAGMAPAPVRGPAPDRRVYIIAVDEGSFKPGDAMVARDAARRFIAKLAPEDYVGVFKYPIFEKVLDLTHDRVATSRVFDRVMGTLEPMRGAFNMLPSEIVDITGGDQETWDQVVRRECDPTDKICRQAVLNEARVFAAYMESDAANRVLGVRLLLDALGEMPHRKMLVVLSGGMMSADRPTGRPDLGAMMLQLGREAAVANTQLYVIHLDNSFAESMARPGGRPPAAGDPPVMARASRDGDLFASGLERLADAATGGYIRVRAGTPDYAFDRVIRETSAYYLLAVAPEDRDRDGRLHFLRVSANAKRAEVRSRSHVFIPKKP